MTPIQLETSRFSDVARNDLLKLFESVPGKKNLVLQKSLVGPVEALVKFSTLQEYGVDRIFFLENDNVDASQQNVIFIACGEKGRQAYSIASQVKRVQQASSIQHDFTVFWVPRRTLVCEKVFEEAGVLGDITSLEWPLWLQAADNDLLSLGLDDSFAELYLSRDPTSVFLSARALMLLQEQHGLFPRILGKGEYAKRLADLLVRMRGESTAGRNSRNNSLLPSATIDSLVIIDRSADFATPLLTQLTYEGLLDETFSITNAQVEVSTSIVGAAPTAAAPASSASTAPATATSGPLRRKIPLTPTDPLYSTLRNSSISLIGPLLNRTARRLQTDFSLPQAKGQSVAELRDFVSKLPGYQVEQASLKVHTALAEEILKQTRLDTFTKTLEVQQNVVAGTDPASLTELVEELIARDLPLESVLRLLCLESVVAGGLRPKDLENMKRLVLQAYGYQHLVTLAALEKMGLLIAAKGGGVASGLGLSSYLPSVGLGGGLAASASTSATKPSNGSGGNNNAKSAAPPVAEHTNYTQLRGPLSLILDDVDEANPNDIAYAYSGYAPLSVRLLQCVLQKPLLGALSRAASGAGSARKAGAPPMTPAEAAVMHSDPALGWKGFEDVLRHVNGPTVDVAQVPGVEDVAGKTRQVLMAGGGQAGGQGTRQKTTVVFFLGGVTYSEVAAVRLLARQVGGGESADGGNGTGEGGGRRVLMMTTGMLNAAGVVGAAIKTSVARKI